jgi:hypothetical protein
MAKRKYVCRDKGCKRDMSGIAEGLGDPCDLIIKLPIMEWHHAIVHDEPMAFSGKAGLWIARFVLSPKQVETIKSVEKLMASQSDRAELSEAEEKLRQELRELVAHLLHLDIRGRSKGDEMLVLELEKN